MPSSDTAGRATLSTILGHKSGQYIESQCPIPMPEDLGPVVKKDYNGKEKVVEKNVAHLMGAGITYLRRFSFCCALGLVADHDDDGQAFAPAPRPIPHTRHPVILEVDPTRDDDYLVSAAQAHQLTILYSQCDAKHNEAVRKSLRAAPIRAENFAQVPRNMFDRLIKAAEKNIEEQKKSMQVTA
jgi:hypothetical protein